MLKALGAVILVSPLLLLATAVLALPIWLLHIAGASEAVAVIGGLMVDMWLVAKADDLYERWG